jgi:mRNA interferase MazF
MASYSKNEVILVRYPYSDLTTSKVRPAAIVGMFSNSPDYLIVPLTSRTERLAEGEFLLADWRGAGLNLPTVVKRGIHTIHERLILKSVGGLMKVDAIELSQSLRKWLGLA